jgi:general secretion pathway protein L
MFITVIQISATEATIARFRKQRGQLLFIEGARHPLGETPLPDLLASWQGKCTADRVILAVSPSLFTLREMELAIAERKKAREILPLELKGETVLDGDDIIFEALPLSEGTYAAIWSSASRLAPLIAPLAEAGLDPEVVTSPPFTWQQLLSPGDTSCHALTDGEGVVVYRDGKPVYLRALPPCGDTPLATTLAAVELAKELQVEQVFACAGTAAGLGEETSPLPIGPSLAATFPGDAAAARDLASAYAVAADFVAGDPVNFRRGPLVYVRRKLELRRRLRLTALLAVVVVMLLFAEAGVRYYLLQRDIASVDAAIGKMYREAFPKRSKPVDEVAELKAEIKRLGGASSQVVLASLKKLAEAKGDEVNELYEIEIEGSLVSGKGTARSIQAVNGFKARCTPLFGTFEVSEIRSRPDGSTGFSFRSGGKEVGK